MTVPVAFQGEVMLAGWSQTHNGGAKVTFWLSDEHDLAAFKAMTVAKGKTAGQRLAIVAVEIGDDEQPKEQPGTAVAPSAVKGGDLARLAGQLCQNPEFLRFHNFETEAEAAAHIRFACQITSRAELDSIPEAARIFHESFRKPFLASRA